MSHPVYTDVHGGEVGQLDTFYAQHFYMICKKRDIEMKNKKEALA